MWTKEQTKLEIAADLVRSAMTCLGTQRRIILCCDSWYPKGCVKQLAEEYANLTIVCHVRSDTALYALPPKPTGKRGRPRSRGERLSVENFEQTEVPESGFCVGFQPVKTNLFGSRTVYATRQNPGKEKVTGCFSAQKILRIFLLISLFPTKVLPASQRLTAT